MTNSNLVGATGKKASRKPAPWLTAAAVSAIASVLVFIVLGLAAWALIPKLPDGGKVTITKSGLSIEKPPLRSECTKWESISDTVYCTQCDFPVGWFNQMQPYSSPLFTCANMRRNVDTVAELNGHVIVTNWQSRAVSYSSAWLNVRLHAKKISTKGPDDATFSFADPTALAWPLIAQKAYGKSDDSGCGSFELTLVYCQEHTTGSTRFLCSAAGSTTLTVSDIGPRPS